ncbi:MAG: hypothetical protein JO031_13400 [Ktedonobacteraceae bacterium]|nr:hypothetical protein [Ktedonobacteraceae bacterium]
MQEKEPLTQGISLLGTLRADGAHKVFIVAVFAGAACKNRNNKYQLACEAGQNARKKEKWNALTFLLFSYT